MANRQIYELTSRTLATTDVLPTQDAAGNAEAGKNTIQNVLDLITLVPSASYALNAGISIGGSTGEIQYNNGGNLGGVPDLTYVGGALTANGTFTGAFTGNLTGTATDATNAETASYIDLTAGPGIDINGLQITASVRSVNGRFPAINGNIETSLSATKTGLSSSLIVSSSGTITGSLADGLIWIVSGETGPASGSNGLVYIYSSASVGNWYPIAPLDAAVIDSTYLRLDGNNTPMIGTLDMGGNDITQVNLVDAVNLAGTLDSADVSGPHGANSVVSASRAVTASLAVSASQATSSSYAVTASYALSSAGGGAAFPYSGTARITGSLIVSGSGIGVTGSMSMTNGTLTVNGSQATAFTVTPSLRSAYIYPLGYTNAWNTNDGFFVQIPSFPYLEGSFQGSQQGSGVNTFYGLLKIGSEYYDDTNPSEYLRAQIVWRDNVDSGTPSSPTFYPKPVYRTVITDNSTVLEGGNANTTIGNLVTANGRKHVLTVTGSVLARDGVTLGTNLSNQHYITGSVAMTGSLVINGAAYTAPLLVETGSSIYTTNTRNISPDQAVYIGTGSGENTTGGYSVMIGYQAGKNFGSAAGAVVLGWNAGTNMNGSGIGDQVILGGYAGSGATGTTGGSIYIGNAAGYIAGGTYDSIFLGRSSGQQAANAYKSTFIGKEAGYQSIAATYNTILGYQAGKAATTALSVGSNNIIIGSNVTLPAGQANSINLAGVIFARDTYSNLETMFSGSVQTAKVGIATNTPAYTLDVSGSGNFANSLTVTGSISMLSGSVSGSAVTNLTDIYTSTAAVTRIVTLTSAEYSGIGSKDANTLYVVI